MDWLDAYPPPVDRYLAKIIYNVKSGIEATRKSIYYRMAAKAGVSE